MFTHEPFWLIISILWTSSFTWLSLFIHHRFWPLHASIRWLVCPESFELPRCRLPSFSPFNHTCFPRVVTLLLWLVNQPTLRHIKALIAFSLMSQHTWRSVYILFMTVTPTVTVRLRTPPPPRTALSIATFRQYSDNLPRLLTRSCLNAPLSSCVLFIYFPNLVIFARLS